MTEADEERVEEHYYHYVHSHRDDPNHVLQGAPVGGAEAYHRFVWHNKHVLLELKLSVIVVLGGLVVLMCVVYIALQCRAKNRAAASPIVPRAKNRREDEKELFGSTDTLLENLIPAENSIRLKVRKEQEFYV